MLACAIVFVVLAGPLLLAGWGWLQAHRMPQATAPTRWNLRLAASSALLYTLAFNVVFFIQELFLVVPKALTPGLHPTLFHNNHTWHGEHPLAALFQGTGALATVLLAAGCALWLWRARPRSTALRLGLLWTVYCGVFMALPQVTVGALSDGSDLGMAMGYLGMAADARAVAALIAMVAMVAIALCLVRPLLSLALDPADVATPWARTRFVFRYATLPALLAILLILPYRVPREALEVLFLPIVVTVTGLVWIQAGAWRVRNPRAEGSADPGPVVWLSAAALGLLIVFQCVLRPGIAFH